MTEAAETMDEGGTIERWASIISLIHSGIEEHLKDLECSIADRDALAGCGTTAPTRAVTTAGTVGAATVITYPDAALIALAAKVERLEWEDCRLCETEGDQDTIPGTPFAEVCEAHTAAFVLLGEMPATTLDGLREGARGEGLLQRRRASRRGRGGCRVVDYPAPRQRGACCKRRLGAGQPLSLHDRRT